MAEETIQIKVIIEGGFIHDTVKYSKDDVSTEPKALGEYFIRAGWAVDTSEQFTAPKPTSSDTILLDVEDTSSLNVQPGV